MTLLTAYFDDSGTHDASDVVVWAGLFGNQYQWDYFSELWKTKLAEPSPGKPAVTHFHMTECQRAGGEFRGWSRAEIDVFIEGLTDLFVRTALWGYGGAVPRKDWNELIKGDALALHGDAEGRCIRNVYVRSLDWAEKRAGGSSISYVFDERPQRIAENSLLYEIFRSLHEDKSIEVRPESLKFDRAVTCLPLQAADFFAWETYQHAKDVVKGEKKPFQEPKRKSLAKLTKGGRFTVDVLSRAAIEKMAATSAPGVAESYQELLNVIGKPSRP
jgi:hypothetical protein